MNSRPILTVTRKETFSAGHRLHSNLLSDEENVAAYGKCNFLYGHGHNYTVEVSLRGPTDVKTGMVVHLSEAKRIIDDNVIILFDHKNINEDVPYFKNVPSTCENVTVFIWDILVDKFSNLYEVKVSETEKNFFVYRGEKGT